MKYIFFGTPDFAAIILKRLIDAGMAPAAVVTNPDRPTGKKKIVTPPSVKRLLVDTRVNDRADECHILQPEHLHDDFIHGLKAYGAEIGVLAAYGKIIPQAVIDVFPKGIIVAHPSLLPKYRGATPIQSAILAGEKETGTTLIVMDEKVDHGAIISNAKIQISNDDTYDTLSKKLAELSADLFIESLPRYLSDKIKTQEQDHSRATYTKKFSSEDGFVNSNDLKEAVAKESAPPSSRSVSELRRGKAEFIWRKVRALNPEPSVYTIWQGGEPFDTAQGKRVKILEADLVGGKLVLKKVQMEGEKPKLVANHRV